MNELLCLARWQLHSDLMNTPLPLDFFYEVALHLSHTRDIFALALTNRSIRSALLTSALFKSRLSLQGWDVSGWQDEDETAQLSGNWKHWMRIDYAYSRTLQLFEEAVAEDNLIQLVIAGTSPGSEPSPDINVEMARVWLQKLSEVLPMFVTHHSAPMIFLHPKL
jgi:hypothetical protein